jgi:hypothetical protein
MHVSKIITQYESLSKDKKNPTKTEVDLLTKECRNCLKTVNDKLQMCITMFNSLSEDIGGLLKKEFPNDQSMALYSGVVSEFIRSKPIEPISFFATNVYSNDMYRKSIIEGNDKFFLGNTYTEASSDADAVKMMFDFKNSWGKLSNSNKEYIKNVFQTLVKITAQYIEEKYNGNQLAMILTNLSKL